VDLLFRRSERFRLLAALARLGPVDPGVLSFLIADARQHLVLYFFRASLFSTLFQTTPIKSVKHAHMRGRNRCSEAPPQIQLKACFFYRRFIFNPDSERVLFIRVTLLSKDFCSRFLPASHPRSFFAFPVLTPRLPPNYLADIPVIYLPFSLPGIPNARPNQSVRWQKASPPINVKFKAAALYSGSPTPIRNGSKNTPLAAVFHDQ